MVRVYTVFSILCGIFKSNYAGFTLVRLLGESHHFSYG